MNDLKREKLCMVSYIWLSHPLDINGPRPPAIPAPTLRTLYTIERDGASVHILELASHTGTHVDAPRHVLKDGLTLHDLSPNEFVYGRPAVVDLHLGDRQVVMPEHLEPHARLLARAELALVRFGYGQRRRTDPEGFNTECPGFGVEGASWIREHCPELRALGLDVPSLACIAHLEETMAAHNRLLEGGGRRFLVIEDMDLDKELSGLVEVHLQPWLVVGMDSAPCNVVGVIEHT